MGPMTSQTTRRTQEERSTATRERLLDATIECLVELGYGGTTTSEIVRRAGVSRGAQVHHYPTKAELVQSAVDHLAKKREQELRIQFARLDPSGDLVSDAIDLLWSGYAGPLFAAVLDLIAASRTDPELATVFSMLQLNVQSSIESFCRETFGPEVVRRKSFRTGLALTINLMHGLALARTVAGDSGDEQDRLVRSWKSIVRPLFEHAMSEERGRHG